MLRFTCGERKIWSNTRKSQNVMTMIVGYFNFNQKRELKIEYED